MSLRGRATATTNKIDTNRINIDYTPIWYINTKCSAQNIKAERRIVLWRMTERTQQVRLRVKEQ